MNTDPVSSAYENWTEKNLSESFKIGQTFRNLRRTGNTCDVYLFSV